MNEIQCNCCGKPIMWCEYPKGWYHSSGLIYCSDAIDTMATPRTQPPTNVPHEDADDLVSPADLVCGEAYQLLSAINYCYPAMIPNAERWLDNLSRARLVHDDLLPVTIAHPPASEAQAQEVPDEERYQREMNRLCGDDFKLQAGFQRAWLLRDSELAALRDSHKRLVEALEGVQPYMEAAEKAGLVGDEGCHWPVEIVRAVLAEARKLEGK